MCFYMIDKTFLSCWLTDRKCDERSHAVHKYSNCYTILYIQLCSAENRLSMGRKKKSYFTLLWAELIHPLPSSKPIMSDALQSIKGFLKYSVHFGYQ